MQNSTSAGSSTGVDTQTLNALDYWRDNLDPAANMAHMYGYGDPDHQQSILEKITAKRQEDVREALQRIPEEALRKEVSAFEEQFGPPLLLHERIAKVHPEMALAAEFKRASPSKGDIAPGLDAAEQGVKYAAVGAAVLSVLTEPQWFKGTLGDMRAVRVATQELLRDERPAVLRKDFIVHEYQALEARASGADTLLLIVAILPKDVLAHLLEFSRALGMEPLVEVHTDEELNIALDCGAKVIGVNNRNLHTFKLDMDTTARVARVLSGRGISCGPGGQVQLAALSGMTGPEHVQRYKELGVSMVLVGEALMRAEDPQAAITNLLGKAAPPQTRGLVKVCGITTPEDALVAAKAGANLIGVIFAERSKRRVTAEQAKEVVNAVRAFGERDARKELGGPTKADGSVGEWFSHWSQAILSGSKRTPLVVGVFQDQPLDQVRSTAADVGLDMVQLHGDEGLEACAEVGVPAIRVVHVPKEAQEGGARDRANAILEQLRPGYAAAVLLDTSVGEARGGTGAVFDLDIARLVGEAGVPVIVAGGLSADNVAEAVKKTSAFGVDVSSGVEQRCGIKDHKLVVEFVRAAQAQQNGGLVSPGQ